MKLKKNRVCVCVCVCARVRVRVRACVRPQIREVLADSMRRVVEEVTGDSVQAQAVLNSWSTLTQHACYQSAVRHYKTACFNWHKTEVGQPNVGDGREGGGVSVP